ncbi:LysM domain-containing protein [Lasiodiplodia theobromae]|uniref:LysM domain-containing protein n=1 Tax=Lasiodiplodia theobromae TaxID=45133 RepID=UPI0015C3AA1F|nr:LysM domain-containing protein [Lasiodiplodia theobromae]KAF4534766.1 LysM domain-containing protein [Lasiodiplodia theobromae]
MEKTSFNFLSFFQRSFALFLVLLFCPTASTLQLIYNSSVPTDLSNTCSEALLSDVACDPVVKNLIPGFFYGPETLERICTSGCEDSLSAYQSAVQDACGEEILPGSFDLNVSALWIPGTYQYLYESTCLKDGDRYCNNVAALAAAFADPGNSMFNYLDAIPSGAEEPEPCDACFLKSLRLQAGSPYFEGPAIASMSLYESMTSSCGVTGQPLTTTTLDFYTQEPTTTPTPCAGTTYSIQPSDDCFSISTTQGIGTAWLLSDNDLPAWCADFPTSGDLCLTNSCKVFTVTANDTCTSIARASNITEAQLHAWNPIIDFGCYNLDSMTGAQLCISAPGTNFVPPTTTDLAPITPTTPATVPTDAAPDSNQNCGRWYDVQPGDYCNLLTLKFGISLDDFIFLNPSINVNCTNLIADESYCVQAVGDINTYSGRPGYTTASPTEPFTGTPFTALPDATETPYVRLYPPLPIANGTRDDCSAYFAGDDYQFDLTGTRWAGNCEFAAVNYDVSLDDFGTWNAGLANASSPDCVFETGVRYCGSWYGQPDNEPSASTTTTPPDATTTAAPGPPGPTHTGQPADCDEWHVVVKGDSCQSVADEAGISLAQFLAWNPAVSSDCVDNFWLDSAYCVGVASDGDDPTTTVPTTTAPPPTTTAPTPGAPTHTGQPANCDEWHIVVEGDTCASVAAEAGISLTQFLAWNPAVSSDCVDNFWLDSAYCVGVSGDDTPTTTTTTSAAEPTATRPPAEWVQEGAAANCNKWDRAVSGDYCFAFAERNGITMGQLAEWNAALGTNGDNCGTAFWLDYYYCIGVSG